MGTLANAKVTYYYNCYNGILSEAYSSLVIIIAVIVTAILLG